MRFHDRRRTRARARAFGFAIALALLGVIGWPAAPGVAQESALPALAFPGRAELTLLAPVSGSDWTASGRLTVQRRVTLRASWSVSGLLLSGPMDRTFGLAAGGLFALPLGPVLVEPFAEAGAGWVDARVETNRYDIVDGTTLRTIVRYHAVNGVAPLAGAGVSVAGVLLRRVSARLSVGWWSGSLEDVDIGGLRVGLSLGATKPSRRWYEHHTDHTPPRVTVTGNDVVDGSLIELVDGHGLRVVAEDASGVAEIRVAGEPVEFAPASAGSGEGAVEAEVALSPPPGGMSVPVMVRDSGNQRWTERVRVVGPPDRVAPTAEVLPLPDPDSPQPVVRVLARDSSGVVDGRIGACPVLPVPPAPDEDPAEVGWLFQALAAGHDSVEVVVRDGAGNEAHAMAPVPPVRLGQGKKPELTNAGARAPATDGPRRSVRVWGEVTDPVGVGIAAVRVDGRPAALNEGRFDGWLLLDAGSTEVGIEALTADGRGLETTVPIVEATPTLPGRLHVLVVAPGKAVSGDGFEAVVPSDRLHVAAGDDIEPAAFRNAIRVMGRSMRPGDVAMIYLAGALLAPALGDAADGRSTTGVHDPVLAFSGGTLSLREIGSYLAGLDGSVVLVSARLDPTRSWGAVPWLAPGALPPPGCATDAPERKTGIADLHGATLDRVVRGITGAADEDGDGRILAGELVHWLGAEPADGFLSYDPGVVVAGGEVDP